MINNSHNINRININYKNKKVKLSYLEVFIRFNGFLNIIL
jgi:hypothetical protein